jgi:hypothetical protein
MNNIYHRYLKLPFEYPQPDHLFVKPSTSYNRWVPLKDVFPGFIDWINSYNCKLSNVIEMFYTSPNGGSVPIHNDSGIDPGVKDIIKINFTWGPDNSYTRWWQALNQSSIIRIDNCNTVTNNDFVLNNIVPDIDCQMICTAMESDVIMMHQAVINRPSIVNAGQLHSTFNPDPAQNRWTLSFVPLKPNGDMILFSEALEIFKDCIE